MIQIKVLTNTHNIEKNKIKNKHDKTFINEWTNWITQSNNKIISEILHELSTKQLNRTAIHSTVHIQQQHTKIHRNLIISNKIWQKYANKW